jgi:hypothetical protein
MFKAAIELLRSILQDHPWLPDLAGILPLSALIDFINVPLKLHLFELNGGVPLWSWPITPAGSRLLLSDKSPQQPCCLDRYGSSVGLVALDGRWGDEYLLSSPETFRLAIKSHSAVAIKNLHANMSTDDDLRTQNLEIIYCHRTNPKDQRKPSTSWWRHFALDPWWMYSVPYLAMSAVGWAALFGFIAMSVIFRYYLSTAFFLAIPAIGIVVYAFYSS